MFYGGNGIRLFSDCSLGSISNWIDVYRKFFPENIYRHITIVLPGDLWSQDRDAEASALGLSVNKEVMIAVRSDILAQSFPYPEPQTPMSVALSTGEAREGLYELHREEAMRSGWYVDEKDFGRLFEKTVAVAQKTGTRWLAIRDPANSSRFAAAIGFFLYEHVCRLQQIITVRAFERRGFASKLMRGAAQQASVEGAPIVALMADSESTAYRLYQKLGFEELETQIILMRY